MSTNKLMDELRGRMGVSPAGKQRPPQPRRFPPKDPLPRPGRRGVRAQAPTSADSQQATGAGQGQVSPLPEIPPKDPALLEQLKRSTPAKVGVSRAGLRYRTQTALQFLADFAVAQAAVESQVPHGWAEQHGLLALGTEAVDAEQFLTRPDLGRQLSAPSTQLVATRCAQGPDVQLVVGDGLSANAVMLNAPGMLSTLTAELKARGISVGTPVFVKHARSKVMDIIGQQVGAKVAVMLLGERPGLGTGDGMSAYLAWDPKPERTDAEKQAISNVHRRGLLPEQAGHHAANVIEAIMRQRTSGVNLDLGSISIAEAQGQPERQNQANPDASLGCGQSHGQQCQRCQNGLPGKECGRSDGRPCQTRTH